MKQNVILDIGQILNIDSGKIEKTDNQFMCSTLLYQVENGTVLILSTLANYKCTVGFYSRKRPEQYIYTYAYELEQNWSTFQDIKNLAGQTEYTFTEAGFIRIAISRTDNQELNQTDKQICESEIIINTDDSILNKVQKQRSLLNNKDVKEEIDKTVTRVQLLLNEKEEKKLPSLCFTLLTDTHHTTNDTWTDTFATIKAVQSRLAIDGIIHLGDFADGMLNKDYCKHFSNEILNDLKSTKLPVYITIGNHDANYFKKNKDSLSKEEQYDFYLSNINAVGKVQNQLWYYQDFSDSKLRILFLQSFNQNEETRYGFSQDEIDWVQKTLESLPDEYKVIICCHDAPIARLDYWSAEIRNGESMMSVLEGWNNQNNKRIMAFIHGHTHADYLYLERSFPIISIGCSKCEYFTYYKPKGSYTYSRTPGELTQELWDTMIVDTNSDSIDFVRFGAGIDRKITTEMIHGNKPFYKTKIWAHRGASGYAPENTLESFKLAIDMQADGIELDVQFTKDRQLVVIHDETIDRVSNGNGRVVDYTLEELKKFNFNKTHPEFEHADIPTLEEVLDLIKPTKLTINIELKTGVNFYEGIEEKVLELVKEKQMEDRVIYSSFNHYSIQKIQKICPSAQTGFLYCDGIMNVTEYAKQYDVRSLHPSINNTNYSGFIEKSKENNIKIHVWTVNDESDIKRMCDFGVDAVITNYPDLAYKVVNGTEIDRATLIEKLIPKQQITEVKKKQIRHNILLHCIGLVYSKVRKLFIIIDKKVQKMAGK